MGRRQAETEYSETRCMELLVGVVEAAATAGKELRRCPPGLATSGFDFAYEDLVGACRAFLREHDAGTRWVQEVTRR